MPVCGTAALDILTLPSDGFILPDYNRSKPFSSFLPGIAGLHGCPLWTFYVNRGQGLVSMGVSNRDQMILEFFPADQAVQRVTSIGYRTFVKGQSKGQPFEWEPFSMAAARLGDQTMVVRGDEFEVLDHNPNVGLAARAAFWILPNMEFPALMRELRLSNTSDLAISLTVLDGLPRLMPYGMNDFFCKQMSRTSEAWMVALSSQAHPEAAFYQLKVMPHDQPTVQYLDAGNVAFAVSDSPLPLTAIVDPDTVFGPAVDFSSPLKFWEETWTIPDHQQRDNRVPCFFVSRTVTLEPGQTIRLNHCVGQVASKAIFDQGLSTWSNLGFFDQKRSENRRVIDAISAPIATRSGHPNFDAYCRQTFLDNVLRGGMPVPLGPNKSLYVFGRKHGDLERDYNRFELTPTPFSQGNGNYRDVNQNRRSDLWFFPDAPASTVIDMMNLIQLDGFNPLVIKAQNLHLTTDALRLLLVEFPALKNTRVDTLLRSDFAPGALWSALIPLGDSSIFDAIVARSGAILEADFHEGYWSDHWHYNLPLIEQFQSLYPDRFLALLWETPMLFYDTDQFVLPRRSRYQLGENGVVRQTKFLEQDAQKSILIRSRTHQPNAVRHDHGHGDIFQTTLITKLIHIAFLKACSVDPSGLGIEMEAGRPNWYDALNGLPALLGSSISETCELVRWVRFTQSVLALEEPDTLQLPRELATLWAQVPTVIASERKSHQGHLAVWDALNGHKEAFREATRFGVGEMVDVSVSSVLKGLGDLEAWISPALDRAIDPATGVVLTYFKNTIRMSQLDLAKGEFSRVTIQSEPLPLFLEGPVHYIRAQPFQSEASLKQIQAVLSSSLRDPVLGMLKVNTSLESEPVDIGRCRVFNRGWLENESIWLHMAYKFLLATLVSGHYAMFESCLKSTLIPFQPAARYGRSLFENSSFISSSVHTDVAKHGQGFVARLSGSTAEFLDLWIRMFFGETLFELDGRGGLAFTWAPALPGWLFDTDGEIHVTWRNQWPVVFRNPRKSHTWETRVSRIGLTRNGATQWVDGNVLSDGTDLRVGIWEKIEVEFA